MTLILFLWQCDLATPTCANCNNTSRVCAGYTRKRGYVFSQKNKLSEADFQTADTNQGTVVHYGRWRSANKADVPTAVPMAAKAAVQLTWVAEYSQPPSGLGVRRVSDGLAKLQQLHAALVEQLLPVSLRGPMPVGGPVTGNWLGALQDELIELPVLQSAITTLGLYQLGKHNKDDVLIQQSRGTYNTAVEQLRDALNNPKTRLTTETQTACMALCMHELSNGFTEGYIAHLNGSMTLLYLRGPTANMSPLGHTVFLWARRQVVSHPTPYSHMSLHDTNPVSSSFYAASPCAATRSCPRPHG